MRRRRRQEPDTRLDWRDPDMPVLRKMVYEGAFGMKTVKPLEEIDPWDESAFAQENMAFTTNPYTPHYSTDPTYNLAKRKRRR